MIAEAGLDEIRLERLYAKLEAPLFNVVYRWTWNAADAQDVVQEAFVKLWNRRESVRMETVEPLVYRIAIRLASNRRRAARVRAWLGFEHAVAAAPGDLASDSRVRAAVDALPAKLKAVVLLCEAAGMTYTEAGAVLEIPEGTVASRRNAAMAALRRALGEEAEHERAV